MYVPLYSKLARHKVMENDARSQVLDAVTAEPAIHLSELMRRTGLATGVATYHLAVLEREHYITSWKESGRRCYAPLDWSAEEIVERAQKPSPLPLPMRIVSIITDDQGIHQSELARRLGMSRQRVKYQVDQLVKRGQLVRVKEARLQRLYPCWDGTDE